MFQSFHFSFLAFGHFWDKVTKIRKYYVIFVYVLQGKMGKAVKKWKENHASKVNKIPKTKIWDERNICQPHSRDHIKIFEIPAPLYTSTRGRYLDYLMLKVHHKNLTLKKNF